MHATTTPTLTMQQLADIATWDSLGPYRVVPRELLELPEWTDNEFRDPQLGVVWSIARAQYSTAFTHKGQLYAVPEGIVLASFNGDLYGREGFDCLWLR